MKAIVALSILLATTAFASAQQRSPQPQRQANPPRDMWCRDMQITEGSVQVCMAFTEQQCLDSRASRNELCYLNPAYDPRFRR